MNCGITWAVSISVGSTVTSSAVLKPAIVSSTHFWMPTASCSPHHHILMVEPAVAFDPVVAVELAADEVVDDELELVVAAARGEPRRERQPGEAACAVAQHLAAGQRALVHVHS